MHVALRGKSPYDYYELMGNLLLVELYRALEVYLTSHPLKPFTYATLKRLVESDPLAFPLWKNVFDTPFAFQVYKLAVEDLYRALLPSFFYVRDYHGCIYDIVVENNAIKHRRIQVVETLKTR